MHNSLSKDAVGIAVGGSAIVICTGNAVFEAIRVVQDSPLWLMYLVLVPVNLALVYMNVLNIRRFIQNGRHRTSNSAANGNSPTGTSPARPGADRDAFTRGTLATGYIPGGGPGEDPRLTNARRHLRAAFGNMHTAELALQQILVNIAEAPLNAVATVEIEMSPFGFVDCRARFVLNSEPPRLPAPGIEVGEIIGHRVWRVAEVLQSVEPLGNGVFTEVDTPWRIVLVLVSGYMNVAWEYDQPARGKIHDELVSAEGGGIHASKDKDEVLRAWIPDGPFCGFPLQCVSSFDEDGPGSGICTMVCSLLPYFVIGSVKLWGEVIEHERGYRGEYGKVHSLDIITGPFKGRTNEERAILAELRKLYGVSAEGAR